MASAPLMTFKAGYCDTNGRKITPVPTPGYLYLFSEDDLIHFCWRPRSALATEPEIDLITIPGDASFQPLVKEPGAEDVRSPTNGRVFVLKFSSSGEKHFFWMQSKSQHKDGDTDWFSQRDQKLGQIVDLLLSGEDVDVAQEVEEIKRSGDGGEGGDDGSAGPNGDTDMMDLDRQETGGAGPDATGGDPREEGEASREGGADGGRAASSSQPQDTNALVQNFLNSLKGGPSGQQQQVDKPYTTLPDLLSTQTTTTYIDSAAPQQVDQLCALLPPELFLLAQESANSFSDANASTETAQAAIEALSTGQKKDIVKRVLRSPQLHQSMGSLTIALRDGGLPMIGEALELKVENGGLIKGGSMPLGGGPAVEAFVKGVKRTIEEEEIQDEGTKH